jgi:hypothetical protein
MPVTKSRSKPTPVNGVLVDAKQVSNGGAPTINVSRPYIVRIKLEGTASILFHRWDTDSIETKAAAAKGSAAKKTDDIDSYVYRCADGSIGIPASYLRGSICGANGAAKYRQDPRSPRKSALDLYRAGVVVLTEIASLGVKNWDYLDRRREVIQRAGITRTRPAMLAGWTCEFEIQCILAEYIDAQTLHAVLVDAGRLCGFGDHRPTHGRFAVTHFEVINL